jgi:TRAP-type C4-dicarboxylate transport system substrate-binding protein
MPTPRKHANHAQRQRAYVLRQKEARLEAMAAKNTPAPAAIPTVPSTARWKALSRQAQTILQALQTEMEDYRDERSEEWQEGEKGEAFQQALERVAEALESAINIEL